MNKTISAEDLYKLFEHILILNVDKLESGFKLDCSELSNLDRDVQEFGESINPRTQIGIRFKKEPSDIRLCFDLMGTTFNNPNIGSFNVMLFDYSRMGTDIGNYVAWKKTGAEVEYSNPFYFNYECLEISLTKQIRFVCDVLRDDFKKVIAGTDIGVWDIPKKDWRSYQED